MPETLLTVRDAAALLSVSTRTVARLVDSGAVEAIHIGRCLRIRPSAVERYITALQRNQREKTVGF